MVEIINRPTHDTPGDDRGKDEVAEQLAILRAGRFTSALPIPEPDMEILQAHLMAVANVVLDFAADAITEEECNARAKQLALDFFGVAFGCGQRHMYETLRRDARLRSEEDCRLAKEVERMRTIMRCIEEQLSFQLKHVRRSLGDITFEEWLSDTPPAV